MSSAEGRPASPLNPQSLRLEDLARVLSASGPTRVSVGILEKDLDSGAPRNRDGTLNLVQYVAWLVKGMGHGD